MHAGLATLLGTLAILLWGGLAALTALAGPVPPFQMTAFAFGVAGTLGLAVAASTGRLAATVPTLPSLLLGLYGFFVYHALYFAALKLAPPAEANLVASLWALLIVLLSALLPGRRLRRDHIAGAALGLAGACLLVWPRLGADMIEARILLGLLLAFACALVWSTDSVASRLVAGVPTESLAVTCLITAILALLCHLLFETARWPRSTTGWLALFGLGIGPVGAAFFFWDIGMKRGDVSLLGVLAYAQPVIATAILILIGRAELSWGLASAVALVVSGAVVATWRKPG
jgi:drug/metabolite transporter (DMT)-like permease